MAGLFSNPFPGIWLSFHQITQRQALAIHEEVEGRLGSELGWNAGQQASSVTILGRERLPVHHEHT